VPLSEEELRMLEQMERALSEEDPKFASTLRGTSARRAARRRAILAGVVFAVGVGTLLTGAVLTITPLGVAGFVVMLGAATVGLAALRDRPAEGQEEEEDEQLVLGHDRRFQGFFDRFNGRFQARRQHDDDES
jgi:hypothetical protein